MLLICWLLPLLLWLFVFGTVVGSFLNVVIARLPAGRSLIWPGSRCGRCLAPVRLEHNIPLLSYWWLRGRCRDCGATFSMRYFWVELGTGLAFVAVYLLEVGLNWPRYSVWPEGGLWFLEWGQLPPRSWPLFAARAVLAALLIGAVGCGLESGRIPRGLVAAGVILGILAGVLLPWPWPTRPTAAVFDGPPEALVLPTARHGKPVQHRVGPMPARDSWAAAPLAPFPGLTPWPAWGPLADWLPPGSWRLGLVTALAGVLAGGWLGERLDELAACLAGRRDGRPGQAILRVAGAFLGWQVVLVAAVLALAMLVALGRTWSAAPRRGLIVGAAVVAAWLTWPAVGPLLRPVLFTQVAVAALVLMLAAGAGWLRFRLDRVPGEVPADGIESTPARPG